MNDTPPYLADHGAAHLLDYHISMLRDTVRTRSYREAILQTVAQGDVVVDIGCGTGILAFFACQAGARHVYAIDRGPVLGLARGLAQQNGLADRITFFRGDSTRLDLPEPVDVLITETLWNFGLGEGILETVRDATQRWLRPGGRVVPGQIEMMLAPMDMPELHTRTSVAGLDYGVDFSGLETASLNVPRSVQISAAGVLSPAQTVLEIALPYDGADSVRMDAEFVVPSAGTFNAYAGWFRSRLAEGVVITNAPPGDTPNWQQAVFPLDRPLRVEPGDRIVAELVTSAASDTMWSWSTRVVRGETTVAHFHQSTQHADLQLVGQSPVGR